MLQTVFFFYAKTSRVRKKALAEKQQDKKRLVSSLEENSILSSRLFLLSYKFSYLKMKLSRQWWFGKLLKARAALTGHLELCKGHSLQLHPQQLAGGILEELEEPHGFAVVEVSQDTVLLPQVLITNLHSQQDTQ